MADDRLNLNRRELIGELMDDPALPESEHAHALRGLRRINAISRTAATLFHQLVSLMGEDTNQPRRVLDVACGDGETTVDLARLAHRRGLPWQVSGCDLSPRAVGFAQGNRLARQQDVTYFQADAVNGLDVHGYDAVVNSLFLHHLENQEITAFLGRLTGAKYVVISDLVRSRLAYAGTCLGVRLLSRSTVVHVDGPLSVRAALTVTEMRELVEQAGLAGATVRSSWPMRQLVLWSRSS